MAKITSSKRAQIRKHQRNTENSSALNSKKRCNEKISSLLNPNEVIEIRVYNLNGVIANVNHTYHVDYEHFKGSIFEELKLPSTQKEQQEYFKALTLSLDGAIDDFKAAVGTFSFLACSENVINATLMRFAEVRSFGIVIFCSDTKISILCMSTEEIQNLDSNTLNGFKII
jgi:hypothetical protein